MYISGNVLVPTVYISIGYKRPTSRDLQRYVIPEYAHRWKDLGALLDLDQSELDIVFKDTPTDSKTCCREMLSIWLQKNTDASWDKLLLAIDKLPSQQGIYIYV